MKRTIWIVLTVLIAIVFSIASLFFGVYFYARYRTEVEFRPLRQAANDLSVPNDFKEKSRKELGSWPAIDQGPEIDITYTSNKNIFQVVPDFIVGLRKDGWKDSQSPSRFPDCVTQADGCSFQLQNNKVFMMLNIRSKSPSTQIVIELMRR